MTRKATALDVARRAGVSRSAVSLVLNGRGDGNVAKDAQERILAAAAELSYTPNAIARSLRDQRSRVIGLVSDQAVTSPFDGEVIAGADALARSRGFVTLATDTEQDAVRDLDAVRTLLDRQVDGLIYVTVGLHALHVPDGMLSVPSALANCYASADSPAGAEGLPSVQPDEVAGGRDAAAHLIALGHRRIAFLGGEYTSPAVALREAGFRAAMAEAGLPVREDWVLEAGWDIAPGHRAATALLSASASERPTALLAGNDRAAVGMVLAAASLGLEVPRDVSIMGYDDERRVAEVMVPPLSTVALPLRKIGEEAMRAVLGALAAEASSARTTPAASAGAPAAEPLLVPCRLVERASTAPAPA
ncbi:LacI family transcriptional regulator [Sinomonas atrocyanea]|uniref:LacI family DNA-binding transcriptional regulator n=1 Tax=Sinomonas atrocyanea TaxID=37927 RepID=UPI0027883E84|nr:LacI family DNA-binding transcriptional regulator [Sinomonas atrocyanea]MDP9885628.1 LacI family transcriptional regulator [Sinomonas atrocyanea]